MKVNIILLKFNKYLLNRNNLKKFLRIEESCALYLLFPCSCRHIIMMFIFVGTFTKLPSPSVVGVLFQTVLKLFYKCFIQWTLVAKRR